jgi:hypothetical protein
MGLGVAVAVFLAAWTGPVAGQAGHVHTPGMQGATEAPPSEVGHAAFATLQEVVRILERDPGTDWRRVDLEALRQHLVDMNEVTLRARVEARDTVGGAVFVVDGPPRTRSALHRMVPAHAAATVDDPRYRMQVVPAAGGGVRVTATVKEPGDTEGVVRIRALGFVGMLVRGMHHGPHHLAIARGADPHGGHGAHHPGN